MQNHPKTRFWLRFGDQPKIFWDPWVLKIIQYPFYTLIIIIWSKGNKLFIYKIIKPPSKGIFRPHIIMTYCTCYAYNIINRYYCTVSWILRLWDKKFMNSNNKETWGGILCCLMNWTKGSRQMLQWGN